MPEKPAPKERRDTTDVVAPYARIRVIVAIVCFLVALAVIVLRALRG